MIEFGIAEKPLQRAGEWYVVGRCVTDIHVGERFTSFVPRRRVHEGASLPPTHDCDVALEVDLTIVEIESYGKRMEFLCTGMTGKLVLRGTGENLGAFGSLCG